jgi:hypothetical protein
MVPVSGVTNSILQFAAAQRDLRESETFIYHAASGQVELVRRALDRNWELLHSIDRDGHTALHAAAAEGNLEVAELLLSRGANPSSQVRVAFSCALAAERGHCCRECKWDGTACIGLAALPFPYPCRFASLLTCPCRTTREPRASIGERAGGCGAKRSAALFDRYCLLLFIVARLVPRPLSAMPCRAVEANSQSVATALLAAGVDVSVKNNAGQTAGDLVALLKPKQQEAWVSILAPPAPAGAAEAPTASVGGARAGGSPRAASAAGSGFQFASGSPGRKATPAVPAGGR